MGAAGLNIPSYFNRNSSTPCEALIIRTQLFSPDEKVLVDMLPGDKMEIALLKKEGPCVAIHNGKIAGTIISKDLLQLIKCLNDGKLFSAKVRSVSRGVCAITIEPVIKS
jgi:hypothetical protein